MLGAKPRRSLPLAFRIARFFRKAIEDVFDDA